jgi:hypothetical protein
MVRLVGILGLNSQGQAVLYEYVTEKEGLRTYELLVNIFQSTP